MWQTLYPDLDITLVTQKLEEFNLVLNNPSNPTPNSTIPENPESNFETVDLDQLTKTIAKIKSLLTEHPNDDSVLDQIKQEVVKLVQLLAQISEQIAKIKEAKNYLIKELANNGFVQPLFQHLENLKGQIESQVSSLNIELETLREDYSPTQAANIDKWGEQRKQEIQKKIQSLESEIQELERVKAEITRLQEQIQPNQNASASNDPKLKELTRNLKKLEKLEMEMRDIIRLVVDNLWEINTLASKLIEFYRNTNLARLY